MTFLFLCRCVQKCQTARQLPRNNSHLYCQFSFTCKWLFTNPGEIGVQYCLRSCGNKCFVKITKYHQSLWHWYVVTKHLEADCYSFVFVRHHSLSLIILNCFCRKMQLQRRLLLRLKCDRSSRDKDILAAHIRECNSVECGQ